MQGCAPDFFPQNALVDSPTFRKAKDSRIRVKAFWMDELRLGSFRAAGTVVVLILYVLEPRKSIVGGRRPSMLRSNQDDNASENNTISILSKIERRPSCQLTVIPKISRKLSFGGVNDDTGAPAVSGPMRTGFNGHGQYSHKSI